MPSLIREFWDICWGVFSKKVTQKKYPSLIREK